MRRKKDTGEPGNRGEFGHGSRESSGIRLSGEVAGAGAPDDLPGAYPLEDSASDPRVTVGTLNRMLEHDQPLPVRAAAARSYLPGTGERASFDPDPYVRALAAAASDLTERTKERLSRDPQVQRVLAAIGS